jgi:hypothetical protein
MESSKYSFLMGAIPRAIRSSADSSVSMGVAVAVFSCSCGLTVLLPITMAQ